MNIADYCWEQCLGCVGILINWLQQAAAAALRDRCSTLTSAYLKQFALSAHARALLWTDIAQGEAWWADEEARRQEAPV